jgi:GNAT superfamily N-acetyltransferase
MTDLLVRLYDLENFNLPREIPGYTIRRAVSMEKSKTVSWVSENFSQFWADETDIAFTRVPVSCFLALHENVLVGFAVYDVTAKGFCGPTGVLPTHQNRGLGKAILYHALSALRSLGYVYAVFGWAGPIEFYKKAMDAQEIRNSSPGLYPPEYFGNPDGKD